jgi:hypothetical protein
VLAVAVVAALLLSVSFWNWYAITFTVGVGGQSWTQTSGADAWHASTAWSAAVLLGVVAAVLLLLHGVGLLTGTWVRAVVVVLLLLALGAAVWQWRAIRDLDAPGSTRLVVVVSSLGPASLDPPLRPIGSISKDHLIGSQQPGYVAGVRPGFYVGLLLLVAELGIAATTRVRHREPAPA